MMLPALSLVLAASAASAATTVLDVTDARVDRATTSSGTVTVSSTVTTTAAASGESRTITYTISGLNLDDDSNNTDSITVIMGLVGSGNDTVGGVVIQNASQGRIGVGSSTEIESFTNDTITYSFQSILVTATSGVFSAKGDFTTLNLFSFDVGEKYTLAPAGGGATQTGLDGGSQSLPGANDTGFTFFPTDAGGAQSKGSILSTAFNVTIIPEPSSSLLLGAFGVFCLVRRRR